MNLVEQFKKKKLLADGKSNRKIAKNEMQTYYLALIPHTLNSKGVNLCKFSTKDCRNLCLNSSGMGVFTNVQAARKLKTDFFVYHKKEFLEKLWGELEVLNGKAIKIAVRLNTISDVDWETEFNSIGKSLGSLRKLFFYDYSKDPFKVAANPLKKYHFTFSFSGGNWKLCEKFLEEKKANVAVVFKEKVPSKYKGFKVVDGTDNDERFLDKKGVIIGLKYKVAKGQTYAPNKFVVDEILQ